MIRLFIILVLVFLLFEARVDAQKTVDNTSDTGDSIFQPPEEPCFERPIGMEQC